MDQRDILSARDDITPAISRPGLVLDQLAARGQFEVWCHDAEGRLRWHDYVKNTVVTVGKNLILDSSLAGAAYNATEFMGLISSVGYSAISAADTMGSHAGWTEAGTTNAPTMSSTRGACAWGASSAGVKSLSTNPSFAITGTGIIKGCFLNGGTGATNGVMNAGGVLVSAGLFQGGDRSVLANDTVTVGYSMGI
jgi:PPE-repeat protein